MGSNTTISQRLAVTFGIVLILFAAVAGIVTYRATGVTSASEIIRDITLPKVKATNRMQDALFQIRTKTRNIVIMTDQSAIQKEFVDYNENKKLFLESISKIEEVLARQSDLSSEEQSLVSAIRRSFEEGIPYEDKVVEFGLKNQAEPAMAYMLKEARPRMKTVESSIKAYVAYVEKRQLDRIETVISHAEGTRNASLTIGICAVILVLVAATILTNSIRGPLGTTVQAMERVAEYDLSVSMATNNESKNELSRLQVATMRMVGQLKSLLENLQKEASNLSSASSTLAGASREVKVGSERQSESTASMAAALEEMSTSISHVADLSHHASDLSTEAGDEAAKGAEVIERLVDEIGRISAAIHDATTKSEHLGRESERISSITAVIQDVAGQTNLLALNAAIEAARAGEAGRGFAVVADEVRKLAEKTTLSAAEISEMVASIQGRAHSMSEQMRASVSRVEAGIGLAKEANEAIHNINDRARSVVNVIGDVSEALKEQSAASQEIAGRVENIVEMIEENTTSVSSVADTASQLDELSGVLRTNISRFKLA